MKKYAIIQFAGKQFKVCEGDVFELERQDSKLEHQVIFFSDGDKILVGTPELKDIVVTLIEIEQKRSRKIRVARFKSKSRYRRVNGHRQPLSVIKVEKIGIKVATKKKPVKKAVTKKAATKKITTKKSTKEASK